MKKFIHQLPKVELHIHIEGSLEPELMFKLAQRNKIKIRFKTVDEVHTAYKFTDLQSFLDIYYESAKVLIKEKDFYDLMTAYLKRAAKQNVKHAEIFFDPQTHTHRNIPFSIFMPGFIRAIHDAEEKYDITASLILCFLRDLSEEDAFKTLQEALPYKKSIIAVGLDSAEVNNPPSKFEKVFKKARKEGFLAVAHAGEEGAPNYIWEAIKLLKASRIDHGVRALEDKKLTQYLATKKIPLTVCPFSNVKLCVVDKLADHPLKIMLENKLCATINSDDPAYFGGYIEENFIQTQKALKLTQEDLIQLTKNAINGTFISKKRKNTLLKQLKIIE